MIDAIHISGNGLKSNQEWLNSISNNVANIQTPGYKKTTVNFSEVIAGSTESNDSKVSNSNGMGAIISGSSLDVSTGDIKATGGQLDIVINGSGFIEVLLEDGRLAYTRQGKLKIASDGALTSAQGLKLSADIYVPPEAEELTISKSGVVSAKVSDDLTVMELGQLTLANFMNSGDLTSLGDGLYLANSRSGDGIFGEAGANGIGEIMQGYMEMSNVDLVEEMTNLVMAQRAYQLNARLIQTADQIMETVNNLRR